MGRNIFIEGLQGTGKSTLVNRLAQLKPPVSGLQGGRFIPGGACVVQLSDKGTVGEDAPKVSRI